MLEDFWTVQRRFFSPLFLGPLCDSFYHLGGQVARQLFRTMPVFYSIEFDEGAMRIRNVAADVQTQ